VVPPGLLWLARTPSKLEELHHGDLASMLNTTAKTATELNRSRFRWEIICRTHTMATRPEMVK
jgi:hypothetical protein